MKNFWKVAGAAGTTVALVGAPAFADDADRFYAGLFAGQTFFTAGIVDDIGEFESSDDLTEIGALVGWRRTLGDDGHFAGVEGDISFALSEPPFNGYTYGDWGDYDGSAHLRALLGKDFGDLTLFGAVGLALAMVEYKYAEFYTEEDRDSRVIAGLSLGAGVEYEVHDGFSVRLEGLYDMYPDVTFEDGYIGKWSSATVRAAAIFDLN